MSCLLVKHKDFITQLSRIKGDRKKLKRLIKKSKNEEIEALSELTYNILNGNVYCSIQRKNILKKQAKNLRFLGNRKSSVTRKRKLLLKGNGIFLTSLLPIAISAIAGLFKK